MQKGQAEKFAVDLRTKQLCIENYVSHRANLNLITHQLELFQ